jgi:hypothetical protein
MGSKPEFDWKINRWNFSSDLPHLYFYSEDGKVFSRFKYMDGAVHVADNSDFAKSKEEASLETCDSKFKFENDEERDDSKSELEGENEGEEIDARMEGRGDTDSLR